MDAQETQRHIFCHTTGAIFNCSLAPVFCLPQTEPPLTIKPSGIAVRFVAMALLDGS